MRTYNDSLSIWTFFLISSVTAYCKRSIWMLPVWLDEGCSETLSASLLRNKDLGRREDLGETRMIPVSDNGVESATHSPMRLRPSIVKMSIPFVQIPYIIQTEWKRQFSKCQLFRELLYLNLIYKI